VTTPLVEQLAEPGARPRIMEEARDLVHGHLDLEKPIIAAINGIASGAGAAFALLCDFVIADRSGPDRRRAHPGRAGRRRRWRHPPGRCPPGSSRAKR